MRKYEGTISWHHEGDKESLKTYKISIEEENLSSHRSFSSILQSSDRSYFNATHRNMKLAIAITIIATIIGSSSALKMENRAVICAKFNAADKILHKLESNGISIRELPMDKILWIRSAIRNGVKHGCDKPVKPAAIKCKRFTARGRSVVCN